MPLSCVSLHILPAICRYHNEIRPNLILRGDAGAAFLAAADDHVGQSGEHALPSTCSDACYAIVNASGGLGDGVATRQQRADPHYCVHDEHQDERRDRKGRYASDHRRTAERGAQDEQEDG